MVRPNGPSLQTKVDHVVDIKTLAERGAAKFAASVPPTAGGVFIAPGPVDMPFAVGYRRQLEQALLRRGYSVSETSAGATVINFKTQTFLYGEDNRKHVLEYSSFYSVLSAIGYQAQKISSAGWAYAAAIPASVALDVLSSMDASTRAEVALTLTVRDTARLRFADTESFYVRPADLTFYMSVLAPSGDQKTTAAEGPALVSLPINAY